LFTSIVFHPQIKKATCRAENCCDSKWLEKKKPGRVVSAEMSAWKFKPSEATYQLHHANPADLRELVTHESIATSVPKANLNRTDETKKMPC
jgi:hypothetical protein